MVLRLFPQPLRVLTAGVSWSATASRSPSAAARMPAVKLLHQQFEANTQARNTSRGTSLQAVSLLVQAASSFFAVPLAVRIHEGLGVVQSRSPHPARQNARTSSASPPASNNPSTFVADAYYATHKIVAGLLKQNNHLAHPDEVQRRRRIPLTSSVRAAQARPPPGLWQQDQAQLQTVWASASLQRLPTSPKPRLRLENKVIHPAYRVRDPAVAVPPAG